MAESDRHIQEGHRTQKAVALGSDPDRDPRPRVLATGSGAVAEQILQVAFANDVKVREDANLVEVLASVDLDNEIPLEALAAVAEILAYVYRANGGDAPLPEFVPPDQETAG